MNFQLWKKVSGACFAGCPFVEAVLRLAVGVGTFAPGREFPQLVHVTPPAGFSWPQRGQRTSPPASVAGAADSSRSARGAVHSTGVPQAPQNLSAAESGFPHFPQAIFGVVPMVRSGYGVMGCSFFRFSFTSVFNSFETLKNGT
jgi:hypothetical protein